MKCNKCFKEIDDNATFCPYCGEKVEGEEEVKVEVHNEEKSVNPNIPTMGFAIAIALYVSSFLLIKLHDYVKGFGDYIVFLFLVPLGLMAMIFTSFGRHRGNSSVIKAISWVAFGLLIVDYVMLFVALIQFIG